MMSYILYLQVGIYLLVSFQFAFSINFQCELKCTKWEFVCLKPSKSYSPKLPFVVCNPSEYPRYPKCADDVAKIVKEANTKGVAVKSFGNQQGQSDLICTGGMPISIRLFQTRKLNADNTVTFGAGVNLFECGEFLRQHGRALTTLSVYGNITLSGAILTGEHGNSLKFDATLAAQVVKMTIINSKGEIQVISCPDELKAFSLNLGLLGICIDITLRTVKLYKVKAHNYIKSDDILSNGKAIKWARKTDELSFYWFPSSRDVVVSNRTIVCDETPGTAYSNDFLSSTYAKFARIFYKAKETAFSLTSNTCPKANAVGYDILRAISNFMKLSLVKEAPAMAPIYTEDGINVKNPAVGYPHMISSPICYSNPQGPNQTFSGKSDIFLSTSYGQEFANIEFRMLNRKDLFAEPSGSLAGFQAIVQTLMYKFNGRSNWGKGGLIVHSAESIKLKLEKCARDGFIDALKKNDPTGVFMNNVGLRLTGKSTKFDVNPLATHCALLGSCFCSKNADCGPHQTCTTLPGCGTYRVCKNKNEQYSNACNDLPPLNDLVNYLDLEVATLAADVLSKC